MHQLRICPMHHRYQGYADIAFDEFRQEGIPCSLDPWRFTGGSRSRTGEAGDEILILIGGKEYESDRLLVVEPGSQGGRRMSIDQLIERFSRPRPEVGNGEISA